MKKYLYWTCLILISISMIARIFDSSELDIFIELNLGFLSPYCAGPIAPLFPYCFDFHPASVKNFVPTLSSLIFQVLNFSALLIIAVQVWRAVKSKNLVAPESFKGLAIVLASSAIALFMIGVLRPFGAIFSYIALYSVLFVRTVSFGALEVTNLLTLFLFFWFWITHWSTVLNLFPPLKRFNAKSSRPDGSISLITTIKYIVVIEWLVIAFLVTLLIANFSYITIEFNEVITASISLVLYVTIRTVAAKVIASYLSSGQGDSFATAMGVCAAFLGAAYVIYWRNFQPDGYVYAVGTALLGYLSTYFVALKHRPAQGAKVINDPELNEP